MLHLYLKSLHIIGFVAWFAGLFYLVRMFVYHAEAADKPALMQEDWKKQYTAMQWRVYKIICNPAMMITWTFGISMLINNPAFLYESWLQIKLVLLVLLTIYHIFCKMNIKRLENDLEPFTSFQYRLMNELPTLFLVAIVLLAVVKSLLNFLYLFGGILIFGVILYLIAKRYRKFRENKD
jgi:putative membrane protein